MKNKFDSFRTWLDRMDKKHPLITTTLTGIAAVGMVALIIGIIILLVGAELLGTICFFILMSAAIGLFCFVIGTIVLEIIDSF